MTSPGPCAWCLYTSGHSRSCPELTGQWATYRKGADAAKFGLPALDIMPEAWILGWFVYTENHANDPR